MSDHEARTDSLVLFLRDARHLETNAVKQLAQLREMEPLAGQPA